MEKDWIVIIGDISGLINSTDGRGGFEFFGPYTEEEAIRIQGGTDDPTAIAVQLLQRRMLKEK